MSDDVQIVPMNEPKMTLTKRPLTPLQTFAAHIEGRKDQIAKVLPRHLTADRIAKVAVSALMKTPALLECSMDSVYLAIHQSSQLGLEPSGPLGHAYLVPYGKTCQLIIGYRGMIDLARRSGQIKSIEAHIVHDGDTFDLAFGLDPKLVHIPNLESEGAFKFVYAVAKLTDGGLQFEVMTKPQIDKIKNASKAGRSGPWVDHYEEMARKTVVRRLFKYLPMSVEMADALDREDERESGAKVPPNMAGLVMLPEVADEPVVDASPEALPADRRPAQEGVRTPIRPTAMPATVAPPHDPVTGEVKETPASAPQTPVAVSESVKPPDAAQKPADAPAQAGEAKAVLPDDENKGGVMAWVQATERAATVEDLDLVAKAWLDAEKKNLVPASLRREKSVAARREELTKK